MKTASFFTYNGPGRISIARYIPGGISECLVYPPLAPTRPMLKMGYELYRELYFGNILGILEPQRVWDDLHLLAGGAEPVLLCWERPPLSMTEGNWCHRSFVAEYFARELSQQVLEMERSG